jgi:Asp-tRNA(Asn)/Glu-tRNA(Gln) amidotransferase A subunit family amidase
LKGVRIGVLRQAYDRGGVDPEVVTVFTAALAALERAGATIVDPAAIDLSGVRRAQGAGSCGGFKYDITQWFAGHAGKTPVGSLAEVIKSRKYHPSVQQRLQSAEDSTPAEPGSAACQASYRCSNITCGIGETAGDNILTFCEHLAYFGGLPYPINRPCYSNWTQVCNETICW